MILASGIGSVITPFAQVFAWVLAAYYSFTHNYGLAIILLTLTVMVVVFPLTRRGTRSMMRMQLLAPELQKIRERYKRDKAQSPQDRQEAQRALNEEMMALYRENGVSPTGGCLPTMMQFPIFIILYDVIRGMTKVKTVGTGVHKHLVSAPQYLSKTTDLYRNLIHSNGKMNAFGLNLADSVRTHQHSWVNVVPYLVIILIAVALQYISIWQITNRNPAAAQANPQMQAMQKFMPLIFVFFYIVLPAGVGVYFIVSSAFRIAQQEYMYKHDSHIVEAVAQLKNRKPIDTKATTASGQPKGFMDRLRELSSGPASAASLEPSRPSRPTPKSGAAGAQRTQAAKGSSRPNQGKVSRPPAKTQGNGQGSQPKSNGSGAGGTSAAGESQAKRSPARSQAKRPRRPR